ncbi:MAG TPA: AAA family ATPase [Acidimicrobiales bacterium]|nr:AAA family ATPase [Acidimicrobiales bacterium]
MLAELHVRDLGVIVDLHLLLDDGMTALTGETGAGKTLLVEAIELLMGGRADAVLVRPGAEEARVEGRFVAGESETVLARAVPRRGRSRAYIDGRLATAAELAEVGGALVDLHGQHAHQSLLSPRAQRAALDRFAGVDLAPLQAARDEVKVIEEVLAGLGGDARARAREMDLLRFQLGELEAARLDEPDEDLALEAEEDTLADAAAHREAATAGYRALIGEGGALDAVGEAVEALAGRRPFADVEARLRSLQAELAEGASDLRQAGDAIVEQPERLDEVRARRRLLRHLCRKYGEQLSDVMAFECEARTRLAELESHGVRVETLEGERQVAVEAADAAAAAVAGARRKAAPELGARVQEHLRTLAMPGARLEVTVQGPGPADDVEFLLAANRGAPPLPLAKVASGGELARAMLAARLVLTGAGGVGAPLRRGGRGWAPARGEGDDAPPTLVFDEVDAGVGGEAALAVGRALADLAADHQVLVVTHLPQVAAFADHQVVVTKDDRTGATVASARPVAGPDRVVELSRMLSGQPSSGTARDHAEELLATAAAQRRTR